MKNKFLLSGFIALSLFVIIGCSKNESETEINSCIEPDFDITSVSQLSYVFSANFTGKESVVYSWYVDNEFIEQDGATIENVSDHTFSVDLSPGKHEVCLILEDDCVGIKVFCRNIEVKVTCVDLSYRKEDSRLIADFEGVESFPEYIWYVNDVEQKIDGTLVDGNNKLDLTDLSPGTYEICIRIPECDENTSFCSDITIEEITECPLLSFERVGDILKPNFNGYQTLSSYKWYANEIEVDVEGTDNQGDNMFDLTSLTDGTYDICIRSSLCDPSKFFCQKIDVGVAVSCRTLSFENTGGGVLVANFTDFEKEKSYDWYVNGVIQNSDGTENNGDNRFDMSGYQSGTYTVCILTTGCNTENNFCSDITIGDINNAECPKLSYDQINTTKLVASFPGIETHSLYKWAVNGVDQKDDGVSVNGNNEFDLTQLSPGTYAICIYSPGCVVKNYFCKEIIVN